MTLDRLKNSTKPYALYSFLWAFLLAALIITPIMIYDKGYFLYYGDFNVQQIPFYRLAHDSILKGNVGWSHLTDLGANFIGSYSFYLLGSPFFWLTMLLPSSWVAYAFGPLLMLKLACASLAAYIYLRRYVRDKRYAVIGGILYAFSSFSVFNIFFFHFHEPMIIFPLLLAALDEFHYTRRRGVMALAVFAAATVNYYFFFGQVIFVIIYYVIKLISRSYRFHIKEFIALAIECVLGFGMSMFLLLPSIAAITGNYRVSEIVNGWNAIIYTKTSRYVQIFISMFFPGDVPAKNNFVSNGGAKWSSIAAYLPMISVTFVIAQLRENRKTFFARMTLILLIMAAVPVFNSAFQCLNASYYARWFYMLTLMMIVITVQSLDRMKEIRFYRGFIPTAVITIAVALIIGLTPQKVHDDGAEDYVKFGLEVSLKHFWFFVLVTILGLTLTFLIYLFYKKKPKLLFASVAVSLSLFVVIYTEMYLWAARMYTDRSDEFMMAYALNDGRDITLKDVKEVRSDFYDTSDNMGMFWQVPNIQAFHSIVPGSLIDFYNQTGVKRDVGSRPPVDVYGLRALLSVKYLFTEVSDSGPDTPYSELMPGFRYLTKENGFYIYENEYYIPMGFTYEQFISEEEYKDTSENIRHLTLLNAMVLTQDQMKKHRDITGYTDGMYDAMNLARKNNEPRSSYHPYYDGFHSITEDFRYDKEGYYAQADDLRSRSCTYFRYTDDGFKAEFDNKGNDNLLFFSIPYDDGWTAYVNGEKAEIEKVNIGFMAVRVPGKSNSTIEFRYRTPLLTEGCIISVSALILLTIYIIVHKGLRAKRGFRRKYRIKQKSESGRTP